MAYLPDCCEMMRIMNLLFVAARMRGRAVLPGSKLGGPRPFRSSFREMPTRVRIATLKRGQRFRFLEEGAWSGYPYEVLDVPASVKGTELFEAGERPVVIRRPDGRYPRYGKIAGYYPVRNEDGKLVCWVVHPSLEVVVRTQAIAWVFTVLGVMVGLGLLYGLLQYLR